MPHLGPYLTAAQASGSKEGGVASSSSQEEDTVPVDEGDEDPEEPTNSADKFTAVKSRALTDTESDTPRDTKAGGTASDRLQW